MLWRFLATRSLKIEYDARRPIAGGNQPRHHSAPCFADPLIHFCFLIQKISENLCQSVIENFLSRFFEISYAKIFGNRLATCGDRWRSSDDFWSISEYRLKTSDDFWRLLMTSDDPMATICRRYAKFRLSIIKCPNTCCVFRTAFVHYIFLRRAGSHCDGGEFMGSRWERATGIWVGRMPGRKS